MSPPTDYIELRRLFAPLEQAIEDADLTRVSALLDSGLDINVPACSWDGGRRLHPPLLFAIGRQKSGAVQLLLDRGADVNATDMVGAYSPLLLASETGDLELARALLDRGADPNLAGKPRFGDDPGAGRSPLMVAAAGGFAGIVQLLLERGADPSQTDLGGSTAPDYALAEGHAGLARFLIEIDPLASSHRLGAIRLAEAAINGDLPAIRALLDHGYAVDRPASRGGPALVAAVRSGQVEAARLLLERGANPNAADKQAPALFHAASSGDLQMTKLLLEWGANPDTRDKHQPALNSAAAAGYSPVVEYMLEHGAAVDALDFAGRTALIWAADKNHLETARILLDHGAAINYCAPYFDTRGGSDAGTALTFAIRNAAHETAEFLRSRGAV